MEKDSNKFDKKEYLHPVLIEYGTLESITKAGGPGEKIDYAKGNPGFGSILKTG